MQFASITFLFFFTCIAFLYYVVPHKIRKCLLLVASYVFCMTWNPSFAVVILFITLISFAGGIESSPN